MTHEKAPSQSNEFCKEANRLSQRVILVNTLSFYMFSKSFTISLGCTFLCHHGKCTNLLWIDTTAWWGIPLSQDGGTPSRKQEVTPIQPGRGLPPSQNGDDYSFIEIPHLAGWGYTSPPLDWMEVPLLFGRMGDLPPIPPGDKAAKRILAMCRMVCLLRSRKRTFLLNNSFECQPLHIQISMYCFSSLFRKFASNVAMFSLAILGNY